MVLAVVAALGAVWLATAVRRPPSAGAVLSAAERADARGAARHGHAIGAPSAPIEVLQYADFQCPGCAVFAQRDEMLIRTHLIAPGRLRLVFMPFPLGRHVHAEYAHHAAECAGAQGRFWPMHDSLYARQGQWGGGGDGDPRSHIGEIARSVGVDMDRWQRCVGDRAYAARIAASRASGERLGVTGTPTFIVNGHRHVGLRYEELAAIADSIAASDPTGRRRGS